MSPTWLYLVVIKKLFHKLGKDNSHECYQHQFDNEGLAQRIRERKVSCESSHKTTNHNTMDRRKSLQIIPHHLLAIMSYEKLDKGRAPNSQTLPDLVSRV